MGGPDRGVRTPPRASAPGTLHSSAPFLGRPPFVCGWVWVVWGPSRDPGWAGSDGHSRDTLPLRGGYPESGFHPLPGPAGTGEAGEPRRGTRGERAADSRRETGRRDGGEGERREQGRWSQEAKREGHWERKAENEMQKEKPSREGERRERMQRGKREGGRTTRARGRKDNASDRRQENKGRAEGAAAVGQTRGGPSLAQSPAPGGGCRVPGGRGPIRSPYLSFPFCFAPPLSCLCSLLRVGGWDWGSQTQYPPQSCALPRGHCLPWRCAFCRETPGRETKHSSGSGPGAWSPGCAGHPHPNTRARCGQLPGPRFWGSRPEPAPLWGESSCAVVGGQRALPCLVTPSPVCLGGLSQRTHSESSHPSWKCGQASVCP